MKNLFLENSLHYYKNGKSKMIKPLGIFRFQGVLSAYYTIPKINRELQPFTRCQGGKEGLNFDLKKNVFFWEQILKKVLTNSF